MGVGIRHQFNSAHLRAGCACCRDGRGAPLWGTGCLRVGRPELGAHPRPTARPWSVRPEPTTPGLWVRGDNASEPVTISTVRALVCWFGALWGQGEGAPRGGGASLAWVWGVQGWALTHARPHVIGARNRGPLRTGCGCGGCGRGDPSPTPQRAIFQAGFARRGGGTRAPGGARLLPGCGAPLVGRSPTPNCLSSGRAAGARYPLAASAGAADVGTRHQPHSARSCELALRAVGAAEERPRAGLSCVSVVRP